MLTSMDAMTSYALLMGTLIVFLLVWLVNRQKTGKGFILWLAAGIVGILLGSAGSYALVSAAGYVVIPVSKMAPAADAVGNSTAAAPAAPAIGGGGMGGMGMGGGPNPKRDLTSLVRKLNLLTDDIAIKLSPDQTTALLKGLSGVDAAEKFSDDDAKKMYDELFAVLGDDQKAKLDAVGLPGGRGGGGGGGRGPGGGGPGGGGGPPTPDANPFSLENNLTALKSFRNRFDAAQPAPTDSAEK